MTLVSAAVLSAVVLTAGGQSGLQSSSVLVAQGGRGQAPAAGRGQAAAPAIPRASDGKPDFSGIWQVLDNATNGNIEPHAASYGIRASQGAIVDPADGKIPYLPAALAKRQENFKNRAKDPVAYWLQAGRSQNYVCPVPVPDHTNSKVDAAHVRIRAQPS